MKLFTLKGVRHRNGLPRVAVDSSSSKCSRPGWMGLQATWSSRRHSGHRRGVGNRWPIRSFPTQTILWFYKTSFLSKFNCESKFTAEVSVTIYPVEFWQGQWFSPQNSRCHRSRTTQENSKLFQIDMSRQKQHSVLCLQMKKTYILLGVTYSGVNWLMLHKHILFFQWHHSLKASLDIVCSNNNCPVFT